MYLLDANILRYFGDAHPTLGLYLEKIPWSNIALPSVVVAEVLRGRCDFALKASLSEAPEAHALLLKTFHLVNQFNIVAFDQKCADVLKQLQKKHKAHKRYADMMIAATAKANNLILVTRNQRHFLKLLPESRLANWIDEKPK